MQIRIDVIAGLSQSCQLRQGSLALPKMLKARAQSHETALWCLKQASKQSLT